MATDLRMDVQPYGDGRVPLTLGDLSLTLEADAVDKLRELLDRAAMPGQPLVRVYQCCKCCEKENAEFGAQCDPRGHLSPCVNGYEECYCNEP